MTKAAIRALRRMTQDCLELQASLDYMKTSFKNKTNNEKTVTAAKFAPQTGSPLQGHPRRNAAHRGSAWGGA